MPKLFPIHVRTLAGLEEVLADELRALGATDLKVENRVVILSGDLALMYKINLWSRVAIRVLRPIAAFPAASEEALYAGVKALDWSLWLGTRSTLAVDAHVYSSFATHSLYIAQLVKDAVVDRFREEQGDRPSVDVESPDLRIAVSLFENQAEISVDASGESLHKRGYRLQAGEAPLRETLAAGIVRLSGWDGKSPLLDAMTGSGTLVIEAGLAMKNIAPGLLRDSFGFQRWADYDEALYQSMVKEAKAAIRSDAKASIVGLEIEPELVDIARKNVERAGLNGVVRIERGDFFTWDRAGETPGTLLMNPPYDARLEVGNVAELYQKLGDRLKRAYAGWKAYILCGNMDAAKYLGLRSSRRITLFNGTIECRLLEFELREGKNEQQPREFELKIHPAWKQKSETYANRLRKNFRHLAKWARREAVTCYRLYDRDIPEFPFIVDLFADRVHFAEIERNHDHSPIEHTAYIELMLRTTAEVLELPRENIQLKKRRAPGERAEEEEGAFFEVEESGHRFMVNLTDYVEVGLPLEHRKFRAAVAREAAGKQVLSLYGYTGGFAVYAAKAGAKSTTLVDTSSTYLNWAQENLRINGFSGGVHRGYRVDVADYLNDTDEKFDVVVVDPPNRSVERQSGGQFDVQADHVALLRMVFARVRPGGKVFFATSFRSFTLNAKALEAGTRLRAKEITGQMTPMDFERRPGHRYWLFS